MEISKDAVCEQIDQALLKFFETLSQLYLEQEKLDKYMRSGYLNMSRARYNMGIKSVGMNQWDEQKMTASLKVQISEDTEFTIHESDDSDLDTKFGDLDLKSSEESSRSTVRKRNVAKSIETGNEHIEDVSLTKEDKTQIDGENEKQKKESAEKKTDPLKWFGILVPQSLRQSQQDFKASVQAVLDIASLKTKLLALQNEYSTLLKKKQSL